MRTTGPPGRARARTRDTDTDGGQGFDGRSTDGADDAGDRGDLEGGSGDSGGRDGDDGIPEAGEVCDDGNVVDGEGSNNDCEVCRAIRIWPSIWTRSGVVVAGRHLTVLRP